MSRSSPLVADPFDAADIGNTAESEADRDKRRKQVHDTAFAKHWRHVVEIKRLLESGDPDMYGVAEVWNEIPQDDQLALWLAPTKGGVFTTAERNAIKAGVPQYDKHDGPAGGGLVTPAPAIRRIPGQKPDAPR